MQDARFPGDPEHCDELRRRANEAMSRPEALDAFRDAVSPETMIALLDTIDVCARSLARKNEELRRLARPVVCARCLSPVQAAPDCSPDRPERREVGGA